MYDFSSACAGGGFGDFAGFQSVPAPQQPTQQPAQFADFGIFQSTPSTGMSQVCIRFSQ